MHHREEKHSLCLKKTTNHSLCVCVCSDGRSQGGVCVEETRGAAAEAEGPCAATGL